MLVTGPIKVRLHGAFKTQMPKGKKLQTVVYATTVKEVLDYLRQFPGMGELLDESVFEVWVGKDLATARNWTVEQAADPRWQVPAGTTLHITPHVTGHDITTAMLITAAITAAVSIAVTLAMSLLFPPPSTDTKDERKSVLYEGGLNTQKEGVSLNYVAGLDVLCGSNLIEGDIDYTQGGTGRSTKAEAAYDAFKGNDEKRGFPVSGNTGTSAGGTTASGSGNVSGGYHELLENVQTLQSYKGGGGKTIRNSIFTDAYLRALFAYADGPVGGIVGNTDEEKERNIFINSQPLRDPGTNQLLFQGVNWEERLGEPGQTTISITPKIANNQDRNVEMPAKTGGGAVFKHSELITSNAVTRVKIRIRINALLQTDKKGNQQSTGVKGGLEVKRLSAATWTMAGTWSYFGKSSDPFVIESYVAAPPAGVNDETWQFRIYRTTADSTDDKLANDTAFNGFVEYQDVDYSYDGATSGVPTALFGLGIDLSQFDQGGNLPEVAIRVAGRKVRVPTNYNPLTRAYSGAWDGSWKTAATQNPVWHWLHLATSAPVGLGTPDAAFNKFSLYQTAKHCDDNVNGRPRYTLNKQFTDEVDGWPMLVELASSFRAFPYYTGTEFLLVQDRDVDTPDHYINNTGVDGGYFDYTSTPLSEQFNEVLIEWDDPSDYFRKKVEPYRDTDSIARNKALGLSNGGIITQTFYKTGCTSRQEAYDFARLLVYISQKENENLSFTTLLNATAYAPGQIIAVDDFTLSGKGQHGRIIGLDPAGKLRIDAAFVQKANTAYNAYLVIDNKLVIRPLVQSSTTVTTDIVNCDAADYYEWMPVGIVEAGGVQPRWFRITEIQDAGEGRHVVNGRLYAQGKFAFVEQNVPVPVINFSEYSTSKNLPAPTALNVRHHFEEDDIQGSLHNLIVSWERDNTPGLLIQGFLCEVLGPDGVWHSLYEGPNTTATLTSAQPGKYVFSVKAVNTYNKSSDPTSVTYLLEYGASEAIILPPTLIGFR